MSNILSEEVVRDFADANALAL